MTKRLTQLFEFLQLDENDAFTLYSIAYEYMQLAEYDNAITFFERLKKAKPDYTGLYLHLGKCYEKIDETAQGVAIFQAGLIICEQTKDTHAYAELKNVIQNRDLGIEDD